MTVWLPSKTFWIVLLRLFSFKFCHILSTVGFINEDNYCHSQRIGQLIKEKLLKGVFKVDWLINVAANTQISPSLLLTLHKRFLEFFFFPKSCLNVGGAAYTRVRLIHESLRYIDLAKPKSGAPDYNNLTWLESAIQLKTSTFSLPPIPTKLSYVSDF